MILNYRSMGHGPPVVVLHGLFGSLDNWISFAKQLAEDYTVTLVDLRNHGNSFHNEEFTYEAMADDIRRLMEELKIAPVSIIGHSMGGKAGMFFTALYENSVEKLIVVDIAPRYYPIHHQQILAGLSSIDLENLNSRSQADEILKHYVPNAGIRQFLLKNLKRKTGGSFEWKINLPAIRDQIANVGENLPSSYKIQVPALFVKGENSDYITSDDVRDIKRQFKHAEVKTISGAGHWVHAEAPDKLLETVREFLY